MGVTLSIHEVRCVEAEDVVGADEVYWVSLVGCEAGGPNPGDAPVPAPMRARSELLYTTRARPLEIRAGEALAPPPQDRVLYPNPAVPAHRRACEQDTFVGGPVYFFELDSLHDEHSPKNQLTNGIVVGHVAGAAAVLIGLMIGGAVGAWFAVALFLGSIGGCILTLRHILRWVDHDDYLGGYRFAVPLEGPAHEELAIVLEGSPDGIVTDDGREFDATAGSVRYQLTVHVDRD